MIQEELKLILEKHSKYLRDEEGGERANLTDANLTDAVLTDAVLPKTIKVENLFTEIRSYFDNGWALEMGSWHDKDCRTTHCLAGWVIILAGEVGRVMENLLGAPWAATLIILESCPYLEGKVPNFYASNAQAMNFIIECAEREASSKGEKS